MKTANELAQEYFAKPPIERVNTTVQDYVFDYQQRIIDEHKSQVSLFKLKLDERHSWNKEKMRVNSVSMANHYHNGAMDVLECVMDDVEELLK